ncbi:BAM_G0008500.mRNA.1.CDS.1 [Saccharomyces cerevisiae]|nr:BAM_G0008500.mRNA.1.CDS.1 [Saccharomyces cerevisiae]CAI7065228.1 BAM_G0008500.mRNA.1.CDS.1 [Saccharomyces cerevisiae]
MTGSLGSVSSFSSVNVDNDALKLKIKRLSGTINSIVHINSQERVQDLGSAISVTNVEDPLAKANSSSNQRFAKSN